MRTTLIRSALLATIVAIAGVSTASGRAPEKTIAIDGSSTVFPVTEAVAEEFQKANKGVKVTVGVSGTGGGFKKFVRGETDISNASRPILSKEMEEAKKNGIQFIELPVCFDALTVVVNKENTWVDSMTVEELKKLWAPEAQGKITRWNQIRPEWPDAEIKLFGAGTDSGTFDYFTEAVVGKAKSSRGDYTASEDDNMLVKGVEGDKNALGYFGFAYYAKNKDKLKAVKIDWEQDQLPAQEPSLENVIEGKYNPLSRPMFIYVNKQSAESKPEVRKFVMFYCENAARLSAKVGYVPLPTATYETVESRFSKLDSGTAFGGHSEVGLPIDELMKKPLKE